MRTFCRNQVRMLAVAMCKQLAAMDRRGYKSLVTCTYQRPLCSANTLVVLPPQQTMALRLTRMPRRRAMMMPSRHRTTTRKTAMQQGESRRRRSRSTSGGRRRWRRASRRWRRRTWRRRTGSCAARPRPVRLMWLVSATVCGIRRHPCLLSITYLLNEGVTTAF